MASPDAADPLAGSAAPAGASSYDEVPYPSKPFPQSHPDRLATVAGLFGLDPAAVDTCRVLELGCAHGDNLIPVALRFPQARLVGLDRSAVQIGAGRAVVAELGIRNLTLHAADLMEVGPDLGEFDYIVAHGVFSWVPDAVRHRILELCARHLSANGIAYVSYNVYPGWHARCAVRDFLLFHTAGFAEPREKMRQAKAALDVMEQSFRATTFEDLKAYAAPFLDLAELVRKGGDAGLSYLFHEYLEEVNEPMDFGAFLAMARGHGLQFVAEANVFDMQGAMLPEPMARVLAGLEHDPVKRERYRDYFSGRSFRQSLLCRAGTPLETTIAPGRLRRLYLAGRFECPEPPAAPGAAERFKDSRGVESTIDNPLTKGALRVLSERWPASLSFDELQQLARARAAPGRLVVQPASEYERDSAGLAEHLCELYRAGSIDASRVAVPITPVASDKPRASRWARYAATRSQQIVNLHDHVVDLAQFDRRLLSLLDGTLDRPQIAAALTRAALAESLAIVADGRRLEDPAGIRDALAAQLDQNLQRLARHALLEA